MDLIAKSRQRSTVLLIAIIATGFAIRIITGWVRWGEMGHDEMLYSFAGRAFFDGDGLIAPLGSPMVSFHPLSAILIGFIDLFVGSLEISSDIIFAVSGALCAVPVYLIGRDIYEKATGLMAAAITATIPFFATKIMGHDFTNTASLTLLMVFMGIWCSLRARYMRTFRYFIGTGIFFGLAYLTRPEGFLWMPVMIFWLIMGAIRDRKGWEITTSGIAMMVLAFHLLAIPYMFWLHQKTGIWQLSAKAGSDILASNWPASVKPQIAAWASKHSYRPLHEHSLIHFFADNPRLLFVKLGANLVPYISNSLKVVGIWLALAALLHFIELLLRRVTRPRESRDFHLKGELVLLVAALPVLAILFSNAFPRHLVYWIPLASLWSARLAFIIITWRRVLGDVLLCAGLAANLVSDSSIIYQTRKNLEDRYNLIPAKWLAAKALPDETGYTPDYLHGFYGGLSRFLYGPAFEIDLLKKGQFPKTYIVVSPPSEQSSDAFDEMLEKEPDRLGNLWKRGSIEVNGKKVFFYQRPPGDNPISDRRLTRLANLKIPIIIDINPEAKGGPIWELNEDDYIDRNPSYLNLLAKIEEKGNNRDLSKITDLKTLFTLVKEQDDIESSKADLLNAARTAFRKSIAKQADEQHYWMVISNPQIATIRLLTATDDWSVNPPGKDEDVSPPMDYGRLLWVNAQGRKIGWVNISRLILSTDKGREVRENVRKSLFMRGAVLEDNLEQLRLFENFDSEPTAEQLIGWNNLRLNMLAVRADLDTRIVPYRKQIDDIGLTVLQRIKDYGRKNNYALIYGMGRFAAYFDPYTTDTEITAAMLGID